MAAAPPQEKYAADGCFAALPMPEVEDLASSMSSVASSPDLSISTPTSAFAGTGRSRIYSIRALEEGIIASASTSSDTLVARERYENKPLPSVPGCQSQDNIDSPIPPKKGPRFYRNFRWNFASVYRRIFAVAFISNLVVLLYLGIRKASGGSGLTYQRASIAASTNILVGVLARNEHVVNAMFVAFGSWPRRLPLPLKRLFAKVYSYGGIHSGCSIAATCWYIAYLVLFHQEYNVSLISVRKSYILFTSYGVIISLCLILLAAHPGFRIKRHNTFEASHRFLGWTVLFFFWAQNVLMVVETAATKHIPSSMALVVSPSFWILICITLLVIYPWTRVRQRDVEVEPLSDHCVKLNFNYANVQFGQAVRLTDDPLIETHAFAVIPNPAAPQGETRGFCARGHSSMSNDMANPDKAKPQTLSNAGKKGFSVIVSDAGDWTKKIIKRPPSKIYTRGIPQFGVLRVAGMFDPVLIVATGSGIGPCLSLFVQKPDHPVRIIWSTAHPENTYGKAIINTIYKADPRAVIIDSKRKGRPNLVDIAYRVWEGSQWEVAKDLSLSQSGSLRQWARSEKQEKPVGRCEAVIVISNKNVTEKVVYGLESRGVHAFGAIFDS